MGRRRIASETEAMRVMDRMHAEDEPISVRSVTAALGGGSSRTVAAYVRAWRERQDRRRASAAQAPGAVGETLAETARALWRTVEKIHRADRADQEQAAQQELEELQERLEALGTENEALKHTITALQAENRVLREQLKGNGE